MEVINTSIRNIKSQTLSLRRMCAAGVRVRFAASFHHPQECSGRDGARHGDNSLAAVMHESGGDYDNVHTLIERFPTEGPCFSDEHFQLPAKLSRSSRVEVKAPRALASRVSAAYNTGQTIALQEATPAPLQPRHIQSPAPLQPRHIQSPAPLQPRHIQSSVPLQAHIQSPAPLQPRHIQSPAMQSVQKQTHQNACNGGEPSAGHPRMNGGQQAGAELQELDAAYDLLTSHVTRLENAAKSVTSLSRLKRIFIPENIKTKSQKVNYLKNMICALTYQKRTLEEKRKRAQQAVKEQEAASNAQGASGIKPKSNQFSSILQPSGKVKAQKAKTAPSIHEPNSRYRSRTSAVPPPLASTLQCAKPRVRKTDVCGLNSMHTTFRHKDKNAISEPFPGSLRCGKTKLLRAKTAPTDGKLHLQHKAHDNNVTSGSSKSCARMRGINAKKAKSAPHVDYLDVPDKAQGAKHRGPQTISHMTKRRPKQSQKEKLAPPHKPRLSKCYVNTSKRETRKKRKVLQKYKTHTIRKYKKKKPKNCIKTKSGNRLKVTKSLSACNNSKKTAKKSQRTSSSNKQFSRP